MTRSPNAGGEGAIPHEVASAVDEGASPIRAWRLHLCVTQTEMAARLGMSQPAVAQTEAADNKPRRATLAKFARALGIAVEQLEF